MDIRKKKKGITASVVIIALCSIILLFTIGILGPISDKNSGNRVGIESIASATLNSTYGSLHHGSTYRYTDYTKVEQAHSGTITDDTSVVVVDSTKPHGSQENPYVIDSITGWNAFSTDMGDATSGITNYGKDKYFVLTKDLDFNGVNFKPVQRFDGTFYGLGHTFSNISLNCAGNHNGLFRIIQYGTVADLNNYNYNFTNIEKNVGGIIAYIHNGYILNCHAQGRMSRTSKSSQQICFGGISGGAHSLSGETSNSVFYRCSAKIIVSGIDTNKDSLSGGIVGIAWHPTSIAILDCHSDLTVDQTTVGIPFYYGSMAGILSECGLARIENCTGLLPTDCFRELPIYIRINPFARRQTLSISK